MINYYIRSGSTYVKIDTSTQSVDLVLNVPTQKTITSISDNLAYYNNAVQQSATWQVTDQTSYDTNRADVLQYLSNR